LKRRSANHHHHLAAPLAACLLFSTSSPAQAENVALNEEIALFVVEGILLPLAIVPAIMAATVNATQAAKGRRPSSTWQIIGWSTGGVNAGIGLVFTLTGATTDRTALWIAGVSHLVLGVTTLALTFWGWSIPEKPPILIGPYIGFDRESGDMRVVPRGLTVGVMAW
jgi:hypothetical protein